MFIEPTTYIRALQTSLLYVNTVAPLQFGDRESNAFGHEMPLQHAEMLPQASSRSVSNICMQEVLICSSVLPHRAAL